MRKILRLFIFIIFVFYFLAFKNTFSQFNFIHITDLHVGDGSPEGLIGNCDVNGTKFNCCIRKYKIMHPKPEFIIASGDISNVGNLPPDGMYSAITRHIYPQPLKYPQPGEYYIDMAQTIPIYFTPGNHEYYAGIVPPIFLSEPTYYEEHISPDRDYVLYIGNAVILMVRAGYNLPFWEGVNPFTAKANGLTDEQCQWMRYQLSAAGNKRKIIVMHQPVQESSGIHLADSASNPLPDDNGSFENNRTTFRNICDSFHVDVVLFGHTHDNVVLNRRGYIVDENWRGGVRYVQTASELDGSYRVITVRNDFITVGNPARVDCSDTREKPLTDFCAMILPNPVIRYASLQMNMDENIIDYELRIYSSEGMEMKRITGINSDVITLDLGNLRPGIYLFALYNRFGLMKGKGKLSKSGI